MSFRVELNPVLEQKLKRALNEIALDEPAKLFWRDLSKLLKEISRTPTDLGEPVYEFKHAKFQARAGFRGFFGIQFAVNVDHMAVFVQRLALTDNHPYAKEFEEILNQEPLGGARMLDIVFPSKSNHCDGQTRRDFLRLGAVGACGLTLPALLQAQATPRRTDARARSVILVYLGGGLSHHDSFDLKPEAPEEIRGIYQPINSNVPGTQVGELLPRMARVMDKVALVRSGAHNNDHHETATNWVMSGRFGSAFGDFPAIGAVVSQQLGFRGALPPYVSIPRNPSFTWELGKSAWLGGRYESFRTGDPNQSNFQVPDIAPGANFNLQADQRRRSLLQSMDTLADQVQGNDQLATYGEFQRRAADILVSQNARTAFVMDQEAERTRDRFGRTTFGQSALLARRLIERDVRFVTINFGGWDHHSQIWNGLNRKLPEFDQGLSALIEDLDQRGLLATTLVVAMGEFGRTPIINRDTGRDHWGPAASMIFAGAGVRGGLVLGQTDRRGAFVTRRPVAPADVAYTIYEAVGVDPHRWLMHPEGRPVEILDRGEPVRELFA